MWPTLWLCLIPLVWASGSQSETASAEVCYWNFMPADLTCPVPATDKVIRPVEDSWNGTKPEAEYRWDGPEDCAGGYCLYSNQGFGAGRGIAVITTARDIERVKFAGHLLLSTGSAADTESKPYFIAEAPETGPELVASTGMARGTPVIAQPPALLVHRAVVTDLSPEQHESLFEAAINSLPAATRDLILDLAADVPATDRLSTVLNAHSHEIGLGAGSSAADPSRRHYAHYPFPSRLTHNCRPNLAFHINPTTLVHTTTAVRTIRPGDTLTITLLDPLLCHSDRQSQALRLWGVPTCPCSHCHAAPSSIAASDARLAEIRDLESALADFSPARKHSPTDKKRINRLLELYKQERLAARVGGAYALAALNYNMLGLDGTAARYAGMAAEAGGWERGEDAAEVLAMRALERDARGHVSYGGGRRA